ncbi:hypothetical protein MtrunA17_Chr4g0027851 [Medicago truncatula]|uniref:Uncharacterized protein n=1 Tax=Medicago truncatula TaxID=3880 RepID=A0A396I7D9_MEDTR|nr:hypothetical protein MtrunA17_Chr4g0027851 [Medicago truncatula]
MLETARFCGKRRRLLLFRLDRPLCFDDAWLKVDSFAVVLLCVWIGCEEFLWVLELFFFCLRLWKIVCLFLFLQPSFYTIKVEDNKEITTVLLDLATSI